MRSASHTALHNFFSDIATSYAVTTEWQQLFEDLSNGVFPPGIHHDNGKLIYVDPHAAKPKQYTLRVPNDPQKAYKSCVSFFRKRGVCVNGDVHTKRPTKSGWAAVGKDDHKYLYLSRFVFDHKRRLNLTSEEEAQLWHQLSMGIMARTFTNSDIEVGQGSIQRIQRLTWHPQHRQFSTG